MQPDGCGILLWSPGVDTMFYAQNHTDGGAMLIRNWDFYAWHASGDAKVPVDVGGAGWRVAFQACLRWWDGWPPASSGSVPACATSPRQITANDNLQETLVRLTRMLLPDSSVEEVLRPAAST